MKISDLLRLSFDNLRRRKGRTALTVIGVVVGTCAIIVMISLGIAINIQNEAMLSSWGDLTQIQIYNYSWSDTGGETPTLDDEMLQQIQAYPNVVAATPYYQSNDMNATIYAGKNDRYSMYAWNTYGLYPEAIEQMGFELIDGSFLTEEMNLGRRRIPVLIGENAAYQFEDTRKSYNSGKRQVWQGQVDSLGNPVPPFVDMQQEKLTLRLTNYDENPKTIDYELVVVGVLRSDYSKHYFTDSGIVMRLSDLKMLEEASKKLNGNRESSSYVSINGVLQREKDNGYQEVYVKVDKVDNVEAVETWLQGLGYQTDSMTQVREDMQASVAQSQMILGGLAAVSLFVAALNIANTMTMAIYERTKEIGVMKVLGCELGKIRTMFLMEAGGIGLLGGIIGVIFSLLISFVLNNLSAIMMLFNGEGGVDLGSLMGSLGGMGYYGDGASSAISVIPFWLILLGLGFSTLVGLLSGILPARRATRISALEAIRHE